DVFSADLRRSLMVRCCIPLVLALVAFPVIGQEPQLAPPESPDMRPIFNGKDLSGWDGDPRLWSVKDGVIRGETTPENPAKGNTFLVYRDGKFDDFELNLKFRLLGGNSGVQYRSKDFDN